MAESRIELKETHKQPRNNAILLLSKDQFPPTQVDFHHCPLLRVLYSFSVPERREDNSVFVHTSQKL